jgi:hypothetical protein
MTLRFVVKAADVVGLYVDPPAKGIVLCIDEKLSILARWSVRKAI